MLKNKYILSLSLLVSIPVCAMERPPRLDAKPAGKSAAKASAKAAAAPVVAAMPKLVLKASAKPAAAVANTKHTCNVCFDEKNALEMRKLACGHSYCLECLRGNIQTAVRDKQTQALRCFDPSCKRPIEIDDLRKIVYDKNTHNQINDIQLQEWLTQQANIKYCPTPNCHFSFVNERADQFTHKCPDCQKEYCGKCMHPHTPITSCAQAEQERNLANDRNAQERANQAWQEANTKPCPQCGTRIEKNAGCMHMKCTRCQYHFCWICLNPWQGHDNFYACNYRPDLQQAHNQRQQVPAQQQEQITQQNAHLLFARDPRGFVNIVRNRHDLRIAIDMEFAERFMRLSCEQQGQWTARIEQLSAQNWWEYSRNIVQHWYNELEHIEPFAFNIRTHNLTQEGTFMTQFAANRERNILSRQLAERITQWIIEQSPQELIMFHNINTDIGIFVCETSLSRERLQVILDQASRHFRNEIENQPAQVAQQRVLEVRNGIIVSLPNVPIALFDRYANYIRDLATEAFGRGTTVAFIRPREGSIIPGSITLWYGDGRPVGEAALQRLVDEAHNHFANQNNR